MRGRFVHIYGGGLCLFDVRPWDVFGGGGGDLMLELRLGPVSTRNGGHKLHILRSGLVSRTGLSWMLEL